MRHLIERVAVSANGLGGRMTARQVYPRKPPPAPATAIPSVKSTLTAPVRAGGPLGQVDLVLLRHNLCDRACARCGAPQDGQRGKRLMIAAMSLRRMVAIEFGMWRSGRNGGSSGSVTVGYGKLREQRGGTRS